MYFDEYVTVDHVWFHSTKLSICCHITSLCKWTSFLYACDVRCLNCRHIIMIIIWCCSLFGINLFCPWSVCCCTRNKRKEVSVVVRRWRGDVFSYIQRNHYEWNGDREYRELLSYNFRCLHTHVVAITKSSLNWNLLLHLHHWRNGMNGVVGHLITFYYESHSLCLGFGLWMSIVISVCNRITKAGIWRKPNVRHIKTLKLNLIFAPSQAMENRPSDSSLEKMAIRWIARGHTSPQKRFRIYFPSKTYATKK